MTDCDRIATLLNAGSNAEFRAALGRCCGSRRWVEAMARRRPFGDDAELFAAAEEIWWGLEPADWREAFESHPRIGERVSEEGQTATWSRQEQAGVGSATEGTRQALAEANRAYEARFGHVFLICATGRTGEEMLAELWRRLENDPEAELTEAADEQRKITRLRLEKLADRE